MSNYMKDIQFDLISPKIKVMSHKQALLTIAQQAADYLNISEKILHTRLTDKEELSSSGIGDGVAIPHLKMRRVQVPFAMLMTLEKGVTCENTNDTHLVDIYGLLISPMDDGPVHLRRLSRISRLLKQENLRKRVRESNDHDVIRSLLIDPEGWLMAA